MGWKLVKSFKPDGHAYFTDERGRLAIADNSGTTPECTDDGVLYVKGATIERVRVDLNDGASSAVEDEARWLVKYFDTEKSVDDS
jgi:hypothetical protein